MNYKESITALLEGLKGIFENKTATEASAIAQAATKPSTIFYTSDTHAIVVGGHVYGRSNQVSADAPFAYLPADVSSPSADPQFDGNHDTTYIQPIKTGTDAGKIKLWWYINGAWVSTDTLDLVLPTDASDITYDLADTPDLGSGDVQSAIEALDGKVEEVKEDVVRTGYLIASWEDDKIQTSTTYAVGSTIGEWGNGVRYGCRGVRLNVKEGDKVLLDTYSPALFGLIFTDENRVVKALYDDRRFDGVWTAPCDGYCYIQDVLYRDNFHYASAHGHLAYMAHDARKRVAKGGDWYNEYAPRLFNEFFPYTNTFTANGPVRNTDFPIVNNSAALLCYNNRKFQLHMAKLRYADGSPMVAADGSYIHLRLNGSDTGSIINDRAYPADMPDGKSTWIYAIVNTTLNAFASTFLRPYIIGLTKDTTYSIVWEKIFVHTSSDFGELYKLAKKIINGEVEVDNFYGVREKEVDFVRNAIGLQSISDLGYNILDHGATLPIDEEGYKYAISERARQNAYSSVYFYTGNEDLVYLPSIDFTKINNSLYKFCEGAHNLITIPDIVAEGKAISLIYAFRNCHSLKRVGDIKMNVSGVGRAFENCYALEYIGRIATFDDYIRTSEKTSAFAGCYSLERVEELNMYRWGGNNFNAATFNNCINLRYLLIKGFGSWSAVTWNLQNALANWGIPNDKHPDARQSLVDSLLTYSYDRVNDPDNLGTADTTCTITLSANSYAQLTASEIEAITAKGYTLTHP